MAFLKLFKDKKAKPRAKTDRVEKKKPAKKLADFKVKEQPKEKPVLEKAKPRPGKEIKIAPFILKKPQITEKASLLSERNDYVFKVGDNATKPDIKKAIEEVYGVNVLKVRTINLPKKKKRLGKSQGFKSGYKKAIVKIKKGQSIEVLPK